MVTVPSLQRQQRIDWITSCRGINNKLPSVWGRLNQVQTKKPKHLYYFFHFLWRCISHQIMNYLFQFVILLMGRRISKFIAMCFDENRQNIYPCISCRNVKNIYTACGLLCQVPLYVGGISWGYQCWSENVVLRYSWLAR